LSFSPDWRGFELATGVEIGTGGTFALFAGPCAIESPEITLDIARELKRITSDLGIPFLFKASYDKANRTSAGGFRGAGLDDGLKVLASVKEQLDVPILTDVHETSQVERVAEVADVIQIPAMLSRQTDLLLAAGNTGLPVKIKKAQFMAPQDMASAIDKVRSTGNDRVIATERGTSFGYNNLVVDMRGLPIMRRFAPVVFDATHAVQRPGGLGDRSDGDAEFVPYLARAAAGAGVDGFFMETHFDPSKALSDGPNMIALSDLPALLTDLLAITGLDLGAGTIGAKPGE
jgi:2-dehydro-3-deoxyphosphooctonate aldolase (KDO 8-P synthase)